MLPFTIIPGSFARLSLVMNKVAALTEASPAHRPSKSQAYVFWLESPGEPSAMRRLQTKEMPMPWLNPDVNPEPVISSPLRSYRCSEKASAKLHVSCHIGPWDPDARLRGGPGKVDDDQTASGLPSFQHQARRFRNSYCPANRTLAHRPLAALKWFLCGLAKKRMVKTFQIEIRWLFRPSSEKDGDSRPSPLKLPFVKQFGAL